MELDKSNALAESFVDTERQAPPSGEVNCLNCGAALKGKYCSQCGQKDLARRQSLGELLVNFISSFWSYESKFLLTGKFLLFKPGILALHYNEGKRERYYHPARMYVFISFVFFLLINVLPDNDEQPTEYVKYSGQNSSDFSMKEFDTAVGQFKTKEQYDSVQRALPANERDGFWMRKIREREIQINQRYEGKGQEFNEAFTDNYKNNVPKIFFILLPIFALILKVLYIRRDFYYSEHLVFSIYYYNFFFLAGCIYLLIEQIPFGGSISWLIIVWMFLYLLLAMKYVYKQGWWKTIIKYGTFLFIFCFCIVIALGINLAITLISI